LCPRTSIVSEPVMMNPPWVVLSPTQAIEGMSIGCTRLPDRRGLRE
jgi:hypothetical protein